MVYVYIYKYIYSVDTSQAVDKKGPSFRGGWMSVNDQGVPRRTENLPKNENNYIERAGNNVPTQSPNPTRLPSGISKYAVMRMVSPSSMKDRVMFGANCNGSFPFQDSSNMEPYDSFDYNIIIKIIITMMMMIRMRVE